MITRVNFKFQILIWNNHQKSLYLHMTKIKFTESIPKSISGCGVYMIEIDKHIYIGSTRDFYDRWQCHRKSLRRNRYGNMSKLQNAYNKYGEEVSFFSIIERCEESERLEKEEYWINFLNSDLNIIKTPTKYVEAKNKTRYVKKIYQYDLDGNFIKEFESITTAEKSFSKKGRRLISLAAGNDKQYKSAYGFQWSFYKVENIGKYTNNSNKAVIKKIYIFNIFTGEETCFKSIAECVRTLFPNCKNFDSKCATVSGSNCFINNRYLSRHENQYYYVPVRNSIVYNTVQNKFYKNSKEAALNNNITTYSLHKQCTDSSNIEWMYLRDIARVKLRESGKLREDNPNPSSIEI